MESELKDFLDMLERIAKTYKVIPNKAATIAVNFTKQRFKEQNWIDSSVDAWKKRTTKRKSSRRDKGAVLVDTGRLRRSIRKITVTDNYAIIGTDVPYGRVHNDGGTIKANARVKSHRVREHSRKRDGKTETVKEHTVRSHTRQINFKMPQRQFLGQSAALDSELEQMITKELTKAIEGQ
jgi:phage gpG-like protein